MRAFFVTTAVAAVAAICAGCSEKPYESRFRDEIVLVFPPDYSSSGARAMRELIDRPLRSGENGYFIGYQEHGGKLESASVATDFSRVAGEALVAGWVKNGILPKQVRAEYRKDTVAE